MRTIRALTIAAAVAAVAAALPSVAAAQNGRGFTDSWFWGIKAGGLSFADTARAYRQAPLAGVDWLITRTHGGLYVSAAQGFLKSSAITYRDNAAQTDSGFRAIQIKNERRLDVALMGFPGDHLNVHPYVGAGFSVGQVSAATAVGPFGNADQATFAAGVIESQRVAFSPLLIAGAQWRLARFSLFGQGTLSPAQKNFILYNGQQLTFSYEFGLRYNVGSSIDRQ